MPTDQVTPAEAAGAAVPAAAAAAAPKRERAASAADLAALDGTAAPPAKLAAPARAHAAPHEPLFRRPLPGETKAAYFSRLRAAAAASGLAALLSPARALDRDGLYVYKRPVRSAGEHAALLASGGTVFHHVVVVVVRAGGAEVHTLEYGPAGGADITEALAAEAPAGPVLSAGPPEDLDPAHLPMLHIDVQPHAPTAPPVAAALEHAAARPYHALRNNCIAFADAAVRLLTGGLVRNAPLLHDALVGAVPAVDPPLLPLLTLVAGVSWWDVVDGGRLLADIVGALGEGAVVPLPRPPALAPAPAGEDAAPASEGAAPAPAGEAAAAAAEGAAPRAVRGLKPLPRPPSKGALGARPPAAAAAGPLCAASTKP